MMHKLKLLMAAGCPKPCGPHKKMEQSGPEQSGPDQNTNPWNKTDE